MTWAKRSTEFSDECANADLSDAAYRTHSEAIDWLYRVEDMTCLIPKKMVRRFAGTDDPGAAVRELLDARFWRDRSSAYEVVHHSDVIRQSLAAQFSKQSRDRRAAAAYRQRKAAERSADVSADDPADTNNQTTKQAATEEQLNLASLNGRALDEARWAEQ